MTSNINSSTYLRTSRLFPNDPAKLLVELNKSYMDIAYSVNSKTSGQYTQNSAIQTGENWTINNQTYQSVRQIYYITNFASFNHNLDLTKIFFFTPRCSAIASDPFGNYFTLPFLDANTPSGAH